MIKRVKERVKITDQDPSFTARYIGFTETFTAAGRGCTTSLVQRLWDNAEEERFLKRVHVKITATGMMKMKYMDNKKIPERLFPIEHISFCNVDMMVNDRIFSWITRDADDTMWQCHAVICSSSEKAKSMSLVLSRAFHIAYRDWKTTQTRETRLIERSSRSQSLPSTTMVKKTAYVKQHSLDNYATGVNGMVGASNGHQFAGTSLETHGEILSETEQVESGSNDNNTIDDVIAEHVKSDVANADQRADVQIDAELHNTLNNLDIVHSDDGQKETYSSYCEGNESGEVQSVLF